MSVVIHTSLAHLIAESDADLHDDQNDQHEAHKYSNTRLSTSPVHAFGVLTYPSATLIFSSQYKGDQSR